MITYQELVDRVSAHDAVSGSGEARDTIQAVTAALSQSLAPDQQEVLRRELPTSLMEEADTSVSPRTSGDIAQRVSEALGHPPERGLHLTRVVLAELTRASPVLADKLAPSLPGELAQWASEPHGAAGRGDTATQAPNRVSEDELDAVRRRIPDWRGDTYALTRSVELPPDRIPPLLNQVERISDSMNHQARYQTSDSGVVFTVKTSSVDAVTDLDIELAERIDDAVGRVGSGG